MGAKIGIATRHLRLGTLGLRRKVRWVGNLGNLDESRQGLMNCYSVDSTGERSGEPSSSQASSSPK
jgi:hypothetical protein